MTEEWYIPNKNIESPRKLDPNKVYLPEELLIILRSVIDFALDEQYDESLVYVLELWEKRLIDLIKDCGGSIQDFRVGFNRGADGTARMYITIQPGKA